MHIFSDRSFGSAYFKSAGVCIATHPWIHSSRIIDSCEIICAIEGILPMEVDGITYDLNPGELLFIPPNVPHRGARETDCDVKFLWFHFTLENIQFLKRDEISTIVLKTEDFNQLLILPTYSDKLNMHRLHLMINQLLDIYEEKVPSSYCDAYLNCILYEISYQSIRLIRTQQLDKNDIQPIQDWIRIHAFEDVSLESIASYFNYNKNYLSRKYKNEIGIGITTQIIKYRIDKAKVLLAEANMSIQEIAYHVGYEDSKYFMRIFKKFENMTPTEYRHTFNKRHFNKT
ncbi:AraC family transcriptional regulator [Paenibacillus sp. FSL R10-2734]|uniref:AraC family transcriptional regulator n=1 Tax=Paenibacillus sp. FSL R10-2734 TaxID=2954691 RepID=UPI0030D8BDE6